MSNRFTKATPVEYLPIDTSLMYKAGLAKDEQIQEGIDAAQKGVDALANMKSSYTTDHNYVNSYYDGVMSNLREKVKNTASFNDPNFKSNINQVINGAIKDPTLWNVNRRNQVYDSTVKAMQSNPKISNSYKTVWGDSYTKQDQLGNPGGTGMINIPAPFEQYNINNVLGENQALIKEEIRKIDNGITKQQNTTTYRGTVKMIDPQTKKEIDVPVGRHESLAMRNIFNDSAATNQLLYDFKASKRMTFDDDYDATEFKDYVMSRVQGYGSLMDVDYSSREMGDLAIYQGKKGIDKAYSDAEFDNFMNNLLTTPGKITENITSPVKNNKFQLNGEGQLQLPFRNSIDIGRIFSGQSRPTEEQLANEEKQLVEYKKQLNDIVKLASEKDKAKYNNFETDRDKINFINESNQSVNAKFFPSQYNIAGTVVDSKKLVVDLLSRAVTGSLAIAEGAGDISGSSVNSIDVGNTTKILEKLGLKDNKNASISFNPVDFANGFLPTFSITAEGKSFTTATFDQINNTMWPLTNVYKEVFKNNQFDKPIAIKALIKNEIIEGYITMTKDKKTGEIKGFLANDKGEIITENLSVFQDLLVQEALSKLKPYANTEYDAKSLNNTP